jgi:Uma2 family endonuclease
MPLFASDAGIITIPPWVTDYKSFCRWADSDFYPEEGRICYIDNEVWVDVSLEEAFSHNQVRGAIDATLHRIVDEGELGLYLGDGMLVTNPRARIGTEPDGMVISRETLESGRIRIGAGRKRGAEATRLIGTPDLVVEVLSNSSVEKDTVRLMSGYAAAGIPEYWLIDARGDEDQFDIHRLGRKGYVPGRKTDGWVKSVIFAREFRLVRKAIEPNWRTYRLEVR